MTLTLLTLNGRLHYNDIDKSLNEAANDKIRKNRTDYYNNPPNAVVFMPAIVRMDVYIVGGSRTRFLTKVFVNFSFRQRIAQRQQN